jgi:hypothetical protein
VSPGGYAVGVVATPGNEDADRHGVDDATGV